jgi:hypothetical protein
LLTKRLARAATLAAALVSSSGSFATGRPLFATLGDVAFKLTAGFSEVEQVRRKINRRAGAKTRSEELDACFLVRDHNGQKLAYVYFEGEPSRRAAAKLLAGDEASWKPLSPMTLLVVAFTRWTPLHATHVTAS